MTHAVEKDEVRPGFKKRGKEGTWLSQGPQGPKNGLLVFLEGQEGALPSS